MDTYLVEEIAKKGLIIPNSTVEAYFKASDLAGASTVRSLDTFSVIKVNNKFIECSRNSTGKIYKLKHEDIVTIDGMCIENFAEAFGIKKIEKPQKGSKYVKDKFGKIVGYVTSDNTVVWDNDNAEDI